MTYGVPFFKIFKCLGLYLKIKGKIGLGGSVKTRNFLIKAGSYSITKKKQKLKHSVSSIKTASGALGLELILSYA